MSKDTNLANEKKKGRLPFVVCFIVVMILCGGLGYFLGTSDLIFTMVNEQKSDKKDEKENKDNNEKSDELKDVEVDEFMIALLDKMNTADICSIASLNYYTDKKVSVGDLSNQQAQLIMLNSLRKKGVSFGQYSTFSSDMAHDIVKSILGKDYNFVDESINFCPPVTYNSEEKKYEFGYVACGGSCGPHTARKLLSARRNDNIIELTIGVLFGPKNSEYDFYSDYEKTNLVVDGRDLTDSDFANGGKYKMTFKNEDGNYVFVSSEPIK